MFGNNSDDDETYSFERSNYNPDDDPQVTKWRLGDHSMTPEYTTPDDLRAEAGNQDGIDPIAGILNEASDRLSAGASLSDFECGVCGLRHGHDDTKHDIRSGFNVTEEFVEEMKYNPFCHCGVNELEMLLEFRADIEERFDGEMFGDLPRGMEDEDDREDAIRSAAASANIATETRNDIDQHRERLADRFGEERDAGW